MEAIFARKYEELTRRLNAFDQALQSDVFELIEHLRTGDVDFAAEAQAAIGGTLNEIVEATGYLSPLLIESEMKAEDQTTEAERTFRDELHGIEDFP